MSMKMQDFKKQKEALSMMVEMRPTLRLTTKDLPEIKKWKVGKEYEIEMKVRQKGIHEEGKELSATFEIVEVSCCEKED